MNYGNCYLCCATRKSCKIINAWLSTLQTVRLRTKYSTPTTCRNVLKTSHARATVRQSKSEEPGQTEPARVSQQFSFLPSVDRSPRITSSALRARINITLIDINGGDKVTVVVNDDSFLTVNKEIRESM